MAYFLIPLVILAGLLVLLGVAIFLGRYKKGKYLRPIVTTLSKVPLLRRWFQKVSAAALERQNPELASVMRKLQRVGPNPDPQKAQQALGRSHRSSGRGVLRGRSRNRARCPSRRTGSSGASSSGCRGRRSRAGGAQPKRGKRRWRASGPPAV